MKKIVIALIMALMNISAFGQITDKGKYFEMRIGDYVEKSVESCYKFEKESGWTDFGFNFADREEAKVFYDFITNNNRRLENKWGIKFSDVWLLDKKEYGADVIDIVKYGRYLVTVKVIFPDVYEQHKENERKKEVQKKNEMYKRLNSLNNLF